VIEKRLIRKKILLGPFAGAGLLRVGTSGGWADRY